ncbi:glycerate kinase [Halorhodospira halochloris]|uniref:glycerate kinase type-2 family protein n=1 Tax=Halorhodospira halochloris TaxID=1052 RepID=UPI001EE91CA2|nr:glycerate kinase [Halorhodospira halochloris]MCG5530616.1 glycerate kinase [Halorhodospira halochloris]MCG5548684.1 glycerate kinase [Halorhodospira halochloris]
MQLSRSQACGAIFRAGVAAVDGYAVVGKALQLEGEWLRIGEEYIDLSGIRRLVVVGAGKATWAMAAAVEAVLGERIDSGVISVKYGHAGSPALERIRVIEAGHPLPDAASLKGADEALALLDGCEDNDLVIGLLSGGASALWEQPVAGLKLADLEETQRVLLASGADIAAMNSVRRALSTIKGGGAARHASPARCSVLVLSDVLGDDLDTIASAPFRPAAAVSRHSACAEIERLGLRPHLPAAVLRFLDSADGLEEGSGEVATSNPPHTVVANNAQAVAAAAEHARRLGYRVECWPEPLVGPVESVVEAWWQAVAGVDLSEGPVCLIGGGEPTVTLPQSPEEGGRSQHAALLLALRARARGRDDVTLLCAGTDGTDGPTTVAGGCVDGESAARMEAVGYDPVNAVENFASGPALAAAGAQVVTGPTQTNVMDLWVALVG